MCPILLRVAFEETGVQLAASVPAGDRWADRAAAPPNRTAKSVTRGVTPEFRKSASAMRSTRAPHCFGPGMLHRTASFSCENALDTRGMERAKASRRGTSDLERNA